MAFKDEWRPLVDGVDDASSDSVNAIAAEVIRLGEQGGGSGGDIDLSNYVKWKDFEERVTPIENNVADILEDIGDIDTALDAILAIQNELIGG